MKTHTLALLTCLWGSAAGAGAPDPKAPLPVDPAIKMGRLPNGASYWIRAHKTPPGKVSVWMHLGTGSINEEEAQRGIAHFLEHMVFNGSKNFPPGEVVKYFESIGMRFGRDQNAFTAFDQTTYQLALPDAKDATVAKGLQCLGDFACRASLLPEEIDKERGVILGEARARKGAGQRIQDKTLPLLFPGSRLAERLPIGKEEVIAKIDAGAFKDYIGKWYRPDVTTVLVVGDVEPAAVEKLIKKELASWKAVKKPAEPADPGIKPTSVSSAGVITDPELPTGQVSLNAVRPLRPLKTVADWRAELVDDLGAFIVNRRFQEMVQKGTAPFQGAGLGSGNFLNVARRVSASAQGKAESWAAMLTALVTETKRAREHGFAEIELDQVKRAMVADAEQSAKQEATFDAVQFLFAMNGALSEKRKPMSEAQSLELLKGVMPGITLEEVTAAFRATFAPEARLALVVLPEKPGLKVPTTDEVNALVAKAEAAAVEAPPARKDVRSLLDKEPVPGTVVSSDEDGDTGILSATLSNGVRVHVRSMDYKKDEVSVSITLVGGGLPETAATRGSNDVAALAFSQPAAAHLGSTEIRDYMTGRKVATFGFGGGDTMSVRVNGSPDDLEEGLRLAFLLLTEGKVEDAALKVWKQRQEQSLERIRTSVEAQAGLKGRSLLAGGDPRVVPVPLEQVRKLTLEAAQKWLDKAARSAPIEAAIVGDMPREKLLALAIRTLGALPKRAASDPGLDKLRVVPINKGPMEATVEVDTVTPRAVVQVGWRGAEYKDRKDRELLDMAAKLLSSRLIDEIREKRSLTYSISAYSSPGQVLTGTGLLAASFTADPDKAAEAARLTRELMQAFAKDGPTDAEMDKVRKQVKNELETEMKEPGYWVGVLEDLDFRKESLKEVKTTLARMTAYSKDDLVAAVRKYMTEDRRFQVIATPKKKPAAAGAPAGAGAAAGGPAAK